MYEKNIDASIFPMGDIDLSTFGKIEDGFKGWLEEGVNQRYSKVDKNTPTLQMWHLNGSENRITTKQFLYTFYELDSPTLVERNLVKLQDGVIFSNSFAASHFDEAKPYCAPLGFDKDFKKTNKPYLQGKTHFGLMGKFEKRKHTAKIIKTWAKEYGNKISYQLTCCITNPFYKKEQMEGAIRETLEGENYWNINFLPFMPQNSQVNDYLNSIDVDLGGMSGAEGWNLPSFNATCLGKWSIVLNSSAHKDWATPKNSILVDPDGKEPAYDNVFFKEGDKFNQGNIYTFDENDLVEAMKKAETVCKTENKEGLKLAKEFTYEKTLDKILSVMGV
jgi:hypothetical protein